MLGFLSIHPVLLIDEPYESLDEASNKNIIRLFQEIDRSLVIVSHDVNLLKQSVEEIYLMKNKGLSKNDILQ